MKCIEITKKVNSLKANKGCEIELYFKKDSVYKKTNSEHSKGSAMFGSYVLEICFDDFKKNTSYQLICEHSDYYITESAETSNHKEVIFFGEKHGISFGDAIKYSLEKEGLKCPTAVGRLKK